MQHPSKPIELFFSYAREDELLCKELEKHLILLRRQNLITSWHRRLVAPGSDWTRVIDEHLQRASVILLLISSNFLNSEYCYGVEMKRALEQYNRGQARVIPILLRHVNWKDAPFGHLQPLPTDARPITSWKDQDEAFANVALGIHQAVEDFARPSVSRSLATRAMLKSPAGHTVLGGIDVTIGRAPDNTYVISDLEVSGHHAVIRRHGQKYAIFDLKSKNGTFVNDQDLVPEMTRVLKQGDSIRVGMMTFEYSDNIPVVPTVATLTRGTPAGATLHAETKHRPKNLPEQESSLIDTPGLSSRLMLKQRYRLLEMVGQGGMGTVYIAQDTQQGNRLVAVKEMSASRLTPQEITQAIEQFQHEANVLTSLDHPNLPVIHESFGESDRWYLVMSFIEGQNLQTALNAAPGNRLPVNEAVHIGIEVCKILEYLHTHEPQVIFRDLKPANIMVTPHGHIYLIDFGIARHFKQEQAKDTIQFCSSGYAPPEQYGQSQTSPRSDIYSLGVTLHQMLSGHNPANKPFQFSNLQLMDQTIPRPLAKLITQMLEMKEQARPASAAEVKRQLEGVLVSISEKSNLDLTSTPKSDERLHTGFDTAELQKRMVSDLSAQPNAALLSYESMLDLDDDFLEALPEPHPQSSTVFLSPRERVVSSYLDDDFLEALPERPSTRLVPRTSRRSPERPSTQPVPRTSRRSPERPSTQPVPRTSRRSMEAFPSTQPVPRTSRRSMEAFPPIPKLTSRPPSSSMRRRPPVQEPPSYRRTIFWISIGLFLGLSLIIACRFWWPTAWLWLVTHWF